MDKGEVLLDKETVAIPVPDRQVEPVSTAAFDSYAALEAHSGRAYAFAILFLSG